jgi:hypothetical protein
MMERSASCSGRFTHEEVLPRTHWTGGCVAQQLLSIDEAKMDACVANQTPFFGAVASPYTGSTLSYYGRRICRWQMN